MEEEPPIQSLFFKQLILWHERVDYYISVIRPRLEKTIGDGLEYGDYKIFFPTGFVARLQCFVRNNPGETTIEKFLRDASLGRDDSVSNKIISILENAFWDSGVGTLKLCGEIYEAVIDDPQNFLKGNLLSVVRKMAKETEKEEDLLIQKNIKKNFSSEIFQDLVLHKLKLLCGNVAEVTINRPPFWNSDTGEKSRFRFIPEETKMDFICFDFTRGIPK
jgi:hypothetical protein